MMLRLALPLLLLAGCDQGEGPATRVIEEDDVVDTTPPEISHDHDPSYRVQGQPIYVTATVTDELSDIAEVTVVFRRSDDQQWTTLRMPPIADDVYEGIIPGDQVYSAGMRYYIEAVDSEENSSCLPEACSEEAWYFPVGPDRN